MTPPCTNPNGFPYANPILGVQEALLHLYRPDLTPEDKAAWDMARAGILEASASHRRTLDVIVAVNAVEEARRDLALFIEHRTDSVATMGEDFEEELQQALGRAEGDLQSAMRQWWSPGAPPLEVTPPHTNEVRKPESEPRDPKTLTADELAQSVLDHPNSEGLLRAVRALPDEEFRSFETTLQRLHSDDDIPF